MDGTWVFHWKREKVGFLPREEEGWVLEGRPNATPDTGWVVAHDVIHHAQDDKGSYREEVETFGAEAWLDHQMPAEELHPKLVDSFMSVMALVIENGTRGVKGLRLPAAQSIEHPQTAFARKLYLDSLAETREQFFQFEEPAVWDSLATTSACDAAVAWFLRGYERARARWPDPEVARVMFEKIQKAAEDRELLGTCLRVEITNGKLRLEKSAPSPAGTRRGMRP